MFSKLIFMNGLLQGSLATLGPMCCGDNFCCNLYGTGEMKCWGGNSFDTPSGTFKAIACHGKAGVGIGSDDKISKCFGDDGYGAEGCTTGTEIIDASMGFWGGCAIKKSDSSIYCWGPSQIYGKNSRPTESECISLIEADQLPWDDTSGNAAKCTAVTAKLVPPAGSYVTISCGGKRAGHFCCAVDAAGATTCFGAGSTDYTPKPTGLTDKMKQLSCGTDFCCGLNDAANLKCFGKLVQADDTSNGGTAIPSSLTGPFVQVSSGNFATYILSPDSSLKAYGRVFSKDVGPVDEGTTTIGLPYSSGWTSLPTNSGFGHACGVLWQTSDSQYVKCFGADYANQVSDAPGSSENDTWGEFINFMTMGLMYKKTESNDYIIKAEDAYFYPAFQSTLTQAGPPDSAIMRASFTAFTSILLMVIYV